MDSYRTSVERNTHLVALPRISSHETIAEHYIPLGVGKYGLPKIRLTSVRQPGNGQPSPYAIVQSSMMYYDISMLEMATPLKTGTIVVAK